MYTELDIGVGRVVQALQAKGLWDEALFVFVGLPSGLAQWLCRTPSQFGQPRFKYLTCILL